MKTQETRHEALIKFLSTFYIGANGRKFALPKKSYNSTDVHEISEANIVNAVVLFTDVLNIGSGSAGNFNLYQLLQAYLLVPERRDEINAVVEEALDLKRQKLITKSVKASKKSAK